MMSFYSAIILLTVLAMLVMLISTLLNSSLTKKNKSYAILFLCAIILCSICEWAGVMLDGRDGFRFLHIFVKLIELSVAPFLGVLPIFAIREQKTNKIDVIINIILALNIVLELVSSFIGFIFYVDDNNVYYHSSCYFIYLMAFSIGIIYFCVNIILASKNKRKKYSIPNLLVVLFVIISVIIQLVDSSIMIDWLAIGIAAIMLFKFNGDRLNQTDGLTGLLNRLEYEQRVKNASNKILIIYFDINKFKNINDQYGHLYGDECLIRVANCLKKAYGNYGYAYRFGGDEFCVILNKKFELVEELNKKFLEYINEEHNLDSRMPYVALGYTIFNPKTDDILEALERADKEMYINKK